MVFDSEFMQRTDSLAGALAIEVDLLYGLVNRRHHGGVKQPGMRFFISFWEKTDGALALLDCLAGFALLVERGRQRCDHRRVLRRRLDGALILPDALVHAIGAA